MYEHLTFTVTYLYLATAVLGMGNIENCIYDNCHLKYHGYCKYHDIKYDKVAVTALATNTEILAYIVDVKKVLVHLNDKPYNFYNIDDIIMITLF